MHVPTGRIVPLDDTIDEELALRRAAAHLDVDVDEMVVVRGDLQQVQQIADRVRLGEAELERRRKRRKAQKASRAANR